MKPDRTAAVRFLAALDCTATAFCFQTFDDDKRRGNPKLARTLHGSISDLFDALSRLNHNGAGVFVAVNAIKHRARRKTANLARIRAVWQDDDHGFRGSFPVAPSIVVRSSPGRFQRLWLTDDEWRRTRTAPS